MNRPRLTYFDMRGRAEALRLALHLAGRPFDERRVRTAAAWRDLQPTTPFGLLPLFEAGDTELCQAQAILRHLAREAGWLGRDPASDLRLDMTQEALAEIQEELWRFAWVEGWRAGRDDFAAETLDPALARLEAWHARTPGPWFTATGPSHADLLAFVLLDEIAAFFPSSLAIRPGLRDLHARVAALPQVAAYLASDARPPVFGIGIDGAKLDPRLPPDAAYVFANPWDIPLAP